MKTKEETWDEEDEKYYYLFPSSNKDNKKKWLMQQNFKIGDIVEFYNQPKEHINDLKIGIINKIQKKVLRVSCIWNEKDQYIIDLENCSIGLGQNNLYFIRKINIKKS